MSNIVMVKYHNRRMLLTLDLNELVKVLVDEFGPSLVLQLEEMTEGERVATRDHQDGLDIVRERFQLFVTGAEGPVRRQDLERVIVQQGRK